MYYIVASCNNNEFKWTNVGEIKWTNVGEIEWTNVDEFNMDECLRD